MFASKHIGKAQTTVRLVLGVGAADEIEDATLDGKILLAKTQPRVPRRGVPIEDPFATFWEWDTPQDEEAYKDL